MRLYPALLVFAAFILAACSAPPVQSGQGPVLISVFSAAGDGSAPREGLFASYGIGLETGVTGFDADALAALPQHVIEAGFPVGSDPRRFSGPRLSAVLAAAGAPGAGGAPDRSGRIPGRDRPQT